MFCSRTVFRSVEGNGGTFLCRIWHFNQPYSIYCQFLAMHFNLFHDFPKNVLLLNCSEAHSPLILGDWTPLLFLNVSLIYLLLPPSHHHDEVSHFLLPQAKIPRRHDAYFRVTVGINFHAYQPNDGINFFKPYVTLYFSHVVTAKCAVVTPACQNTPSHSIQPSLSQCQLWECSLELHVCAPYSTIPEISVCA